MALLTPKPAPTTKAPAPTRDRPMVTRATPAQVTKYGAKNQQHGFSPISEMPMPKRLVVSAEAVEKQGKTHFALTAPAPIGYINIDVGMEGVVDKFKGKDIRVSTYMGEAATLKDVVNPTDAAKKAERVYDKIVKDYRYSIANFRTTVVDTASDWWEILRISRFGKLLQVKSHHYGPVNAEWDALIKEIYATGNNLILLHRLKDEWVNELDAAKKEVSRKTGRLERAGQKNVGFLVQVNVRLSRDLDDDGMGHFHLDIINCRHNPAVDGMRLSDEMLTFGELAQLVIEDSTAKDWE